MSEKRNVNLFGAAGLVAFATLLAFNQVVVKVTSYGFGPVFQAGCRSLGALVLLLIYMWWTSASISATRAMLPWGLLCGVISALEFLFLFTSLDLTTVARASIIFYSMPVWLAMASHFLLPGERLSGLRALGLGLAMAGVALALADKTGRQGSVLGDFLALMGAISWAALSICLRLTPLSRETPEMQLVYNLSVSAFVLLVSAILWSEPVRQPHALHVAGLGFQIIAVAFLGFLFWFWLVSIYKASAVASFSFLTPVIAVMMGWLILGEQIGFEVGTALILVTAGLFLINRR